MKNGGNKRSEKGLTDPRVEKKVRKATENSGREMIKKEEDGTETERRKTKEGNRENE